MKILVPVSGGKDSHACLKLAVQEHGSESVRGLFCDTRFEHPLTYEHVATLEVLYGVQIDYINDGSVEDRCIQFGRFPGGGSRHCTDYLKIRPTKRYLAALGKCNVEVWYGMRNAESAERKARYIGKIDSELYMPHEVMPSKYPKYLGNNGIRFRMPIIDWSVSDVKEFVGDENLNPLYAQGFDRVGCFPCLAGGDRAKEKAFQHDDFGRKQYKKVMIVSEKIGKSIWTSKGGKFRNESDQGCLICSI